MLQRTVGNYNTKTTTHGKSTRNRALQKVSWNSLKIHSFDFGNGMFGNVTSLEDRESIKWKLWPIFEWFLQMGKKYRLVVNFQSVMPYSISIHVRLRVRNCTFDGRISSASLPWRVMKWSKLLWAIVEFPNGTIHTRIHSHMTDTQRQWHRNLFIITCPSRNGVLHMCSWAHSHSSNNLMNVF